MMFEIKMFPKIRILEKFLPKNGSFLGSRRDKTKIVISYPILT